MAKKKTQSKSAKKGIGGWIIVILIAFIISALNALYLIAQRVSWVLTQNIEWGVKVSLFLLIIYFALICCSIYLILRKKKKAVETSITALIFGMIFLLWYYLIGRIVFSYDKIMIIAGIFSILVNFAIIILIIFYLKKSKRVKSTFTR